MENIPEEHAEHFEADSREHHEVMKGFNDWQTGIKFNEQQRDWLKDNLQYQLDNDDLISNTSIAIARSIINLLENSNG